jgi:large subunit ribosomal protein L23
MAKDPKQSKEKPKFKAKKAEKVFDYLIREMETEKTGLAKKFNKYYFIVKKKANKVEIAQMIEDYYQVKVTKVNVINYKSKKVRFGLIEGKSKAFKKAIVSLKEGDSIK